MDTAHMTTVQRLQLELLRYMDDDIDGALIVADLLAHRDEWVSVMADRVPFAPSLIPVTLPDMIRLRDLPEDKWRTTMLLILTDATGARLFARLSRERWQPTRVLLLSRDDVLLASLCLMPEGTCVVCMEW